MVIAVFSFTAGLHDLGAITSQYLLQFETTSQDETIIALNRRNTEHDLIQLYTCTYKQTHGLARSWQKEERICHNKKEYKMQRYLIIKPMMIGALLMSIWNCDLVRTSDEADQEPISLDELQLNEAFTFQTKVEINFSIQALDNQGQPLEKVIISAFMEDSDGVEKRLFSSATDEDGFVQLNHPIPSYVSEVIIRTAYIGLPSEAKLPVIEGQVTCDLSNLPAEEDDIAATIAKVGVASSSYQITYLGAYDRWGKPRYLEPERDVIDQEFLNDVNASLPELRPVPEYHPEYLASESQVNTLLGEPADVWVTFVHEGAGYKNVLGFYTYPVGSPPQSVNDIDSVTIVFPNVSYFGSGGRLQSGHKVNIGYFPAGTTIGWVLFADGFNGDVTLGNHQVYSNYPLNPESTPERQKHTVLLNDAARDLTILGFEDLNRDAGSDDDFNDAIFYVTSNPREAIITVDLVPVTYTGNDTDGDGINDPVDDYPEDPSRAFDNHFPAENVFGSLAFEDLWPQRGDYDFNDLVVDYHFKEILNAENEVVEIEADLMIKAVGASYENGFGFELNLPVEAVSQVIGSNIQGNAVTLNTNGTEADQSKAVIIAFDNAYHVVQRPDGFYFNTQPDAPYRVSDTLHLQIMLTEPVASDLLISPPYNPFIFINQNRVREVHLAGYGPTDIASGSEFFDTGDDYSSDVGFYKTNNYLPWAMDITESLTYPVERIAINQAHNHFVAWAVAAGQDYPDWYKNKPGYRIPENIYQP
jgi:LruC domain-containing protein